MMIPEKLKNLAPYDPTMGLPEVKLDANESFLTLPDYIMEKVNKAVSDVLLNRYPDPCADELCRAAADYFGVKPDQVVASNGSDEMISIIMNCFLDKGSRVLVTKPDFSMYAFYAQMAEMELVVMDKADRQLNPRALISKAKESRANAVLFSNPCNPTGNGISREQVLEIAKALPDALVVVDEAYMDFWDQSIMGDFEDYDNVIILRTCSKAFGLAGIRLGFAIAKEEIIDLIRKAKSPFNVNSVTQAIAACVIKEKEYLKSAIADIVNSREALQNELKALEITGKIKVLPSCANFSLVETEYADAIYSQLDKQGIKIRKFPGVLRITAGSDEENAKLIGALADILKSL